MSMSKCGELRFVNNVQKELQNRFKLSADICALDASDNIGLDKCGEAGQGFPDLKLELRVRGHRKCAVVELKLCARSRESFKRPDKSPLYDAMSKFDRIKHLNQAFSWCAKFVVLADNVTRWAPEEQIKHLEKHGIVVVSESGFISELLKRDCP